jgi:hypothetical protein
MVTIKLTQQEINLLEYTFKKALEFTGGDDTQPDQDCIDAVNEKLSSAMIRASKIT